MGGKYPPNWAGKNERIGDCSSLNGSYKNVGDSAENPHSWPMLSVFFQFPYSDWKRTSELRISVKGNSNVNATIWDENEVQIPGNSKLVYTCSSGKLVWEGDDSEFSEGRGKDNPLFGVQKRKIEISKGTDGALYVLNEESGGGLVYMFLPLVYSASSWTKFDSK